MRSKILGVLVLIAVCALLVISTTAQDEASNRINHNGQDLFLSGINLAWINFGRDLRNFDEPRFVAALDEIADAKGNTLRWWLHTNGSTSPIYGDDGMVVGLGEDDINNMRRALDLAYERGILIMMCLWSHDMMNDQVNTEWNRLLIEDPEYTQAYIDNALTPMVTALAGHPAIVSWEIFNEPEGTTEEFGWTDARTTMPYIQQFTNLLAGAIHRADPEALVTTGSWSFRAQTDVGGFTNYYTDERLIEAGDDPDGTLDFYSVHYYPEHFDETLSPFHNPASYWELDKPIVVGEFPAAGLRDIGFGYRPRRQLRYSPDTYEYLFENGYAGALSWAYTDANHGGMLDASSGMLRIANFLDAEAVTVDIGDIDRIPVVVGSIENAVIPNDTSALEAYADLIEVFSDVEDGANLTYTISENSRPDIVEVVIGDDNTLSLNLAGVIGTSSLEITATDSANHTSSIEFVVQVVDPNVGNVAIGKPAVSSTEESAQYAASFATDGLPDTRSSTEYSDPQWLIVDLEDVFTINQVVLRWEAAYGQEYDLQAWDGSAWQTLYHEPMGDGEIDDIALPEPVDTRYVRFSGTQRGEEWGYSLWEFEVYGIRAESSDAALQTEPSDWALALEAASAAPAEMETTQLYSFEEAGEGWAVVDFWTAITSAEPTDETANDGDASLALSGVFSGTAWEEGGAFISLPEGEDWSAYNLLLVDVFVPEGADSFISQIYMKTGEEFTWANTPDIALTPGEWNTLSADLSTLGDIADVREVGIKIGTSVTAFEGVFFVDNIALATVTETDATTETAVEMETTTLASFEEDAEGWAVVDFWTAITSLTQTDIMASDGSASLAASGTYSGTAWEEGGIFIVPPEGTDWSAYDLLTVDVFVPEGAEDFISQVYLKTGEEFTWANTPDLALVAGQWNTLSADLSVLGDIADVREIGIKIGTSVTLFDGTFFIDNIALATMSEAEAPVEETITEDLVSIPLFTFEADQEGWAIVDFWTAITSLEHSTEMASEGSASVAASGAFSGTAWEEGGIFIVPPEGTDWSNYALLTVDVYVPEGADNFISQIYLKTGEEWMWANTPDIQLVAGEWNTLTADLSALGDIADVREVGIKIGTSVTPFEGTFYVDNVQLLSE